MGGLWVVLAIVLLVGLAQALFTSIGDRTVSYSEFKEMVRALHQAGIEVTVDEGTIVLNEL